MPPPGLGAVLAAPSEQPSTEFAARAKATWARLIRKVYETDALECPKCKWPMRAIARIEDTRVIRRILEQLGLWAPQAMQRSAPLDFASWPPYPSVPLSYHPVPDLA